MSHPGPNARPLNSDELGEKGEKRFGELCADAKLVCNKAERDRAGWDFYVDFPIATLSPSDTLDSRGPPLSCRVQLKTVWARDDARVALSLNAAEKLAKDAKPAFLCILLVDEDLSFRTVRLIHMLDDPLARVLKRLREAHLKPDVKLSELTITFDAEQGLALPLTGAALRGSLAAAIGTDMAAYIAAKEAQRTSLGYEAGRYRLTTTFSASNFGELVEIGLGLRKADATSLAVHDVRFEIPVPVDHLGGATSGALRLAPAPVDRCTIRIVSRGRGHPAVFEADMLECAFPGVPDEHRRTLFRSELFTLDIRGDGRVGFNSLDDQVLGARLKLEDWAHYFRLRVLMAAGPVTFEVRCRKRNGLLSVPITTIDGARRAYAESLTRLNERAQHLLRQAGATGSPITFQELLNAADDIETAYATLNDSDELEPLSFTTIVSQEAQLQAPTDTISFLLARYLKLGPDVLAYASVHLMEPTSTDEGFAWQQLKTEVHRITQISDELDDLQAFARDAQAETGAQGLLLPAPDPPVEETV